ncbi:MAG: NADH-quinone oxidoreductase subunit D [Gemmatimonadetes bacterium]|jgi:NADH-quinone oxidoreductase subunit D|nr:NADH-quinone oxidoreductase subunit D [Gemmatimonadota bacterium]MBT5058901.1 NADH-quinone oxidoreductase subunit D [Gemmatimonadota bacterium]MBT5144391.1 NADH-quinone oxidoreductase subunit D [Gemmatimonadota bacterium]MBT5587091.1 NADH-quinone oxidoreductase subunit D [Gemmatimonadota bacterium]MBT5960359.1 NADH-quinone oxidoreductase subunit D [Gemmatimonadota bacterium]
MTPVAEDSAEELAQSQRIESSQLPAVLAARYPGEVRLVDLVHPVDDDSAILILASDRGYDLLAINGDPRPLLQNRWPSVQPVAAQSSAHLPGEPTRFDDLPGFLSLGDGGTTTRRRLQLAVVVDGDRIVDIATRAGLLTCGLAQLARHHTYLQLPVLAEGLNEQSPNTCALATVLGIEALAQIDPPEAIQHARVFMAELERVQAHCGWLVLQASACADEALVNEARHARERLAQLFVDVCGRRRPTGIHLPGRILIDRDPAESALTEVTNHLTCLIRTARQSLAGRGGWRRRLTGVGVVGAEEVVERMLSGPMARASGVAIDVRRHTPYLTYNQLDFDLAVRTGGDVVDRCEVRLDEMAQSLLLAQRALASSQGPLQIDDLRIAPPESPASTAQMIHHFEMWMEGHGLQPKPGAEAFVAVEAPEGEFGILLQSDGSSKPSIVHWRSPSHYHYQLLPRLLMGQYLDDAFDLLASVNLNAAEMDQ